MPSASSRPPHANPAAHYSSPLRASSASPDLHDGSPVFLSYPSSTRLSRNPSPLPARSPVLQAGGSAAAVTAPPPAVAARHPTQRASESDTDTEAWRAEQDWGDVDEDDEYNTDMPSDLRPSPHRLPSGMSHTPLLNNSKKERYGDTPAGSGVAARKSTFHERDPDVTGKDAARRKYMYAAGFLALSLVSFVVQTETAVYIQHELGWNKAYCMLYLTHGSWSFLWFLQLLILRLQKWDMPWQTFWRRHVQILRQTALMVQHQDLNAPQKYSDRSPVPYMARTIATITCALTVAGGSWYVAVDLTTADDLTAIYNCSAFFAYVFSIFLLKEKVRLSKVVSVLVAMAGVFVVAYGGASTAKDSDATNRSVGNLVISVGSVLYGFYEVLYKYMACPPEGTSPGRSMIFANMVGTCIGMFTLTVLWIPIPILHFTGIETFAMPQGRAAWLLFISTFANAVFSGSFLVLISLTSPVLSSVAALLTIFLVALVDQLLPPPLYNPLSGAAIIGGCLIIGAFGLLSWATYAEMDEESNHKHAVDEEGIEESDVEVESE